MPENMQVATGKLEHCSRSSGRKQVKSHRKGQAIRGGLGGGGVGSETTELGIEEESSFIRPDEAMAQ